MHVKHLINFHNCCMCKDHLRSLIQGTSNGKVLLTRLARVVPSQISSWTGDASLPWIAVVGASWTYAWKIRTEADAV